MADLTPEQEAWLNEIIGEEGGGAGTVTDDDLQAEPNQNEEPPEQVSQDKVVEWYQDLNTQSKELIDRLMKEQERLEAQQNNANEAEPQEEKPVEFALPAEVEELKESDPDLYKAFNAMKSMVDNQNEQLTGLQSQLADMTVEQEKRAIDMHMQQIHSKHPDLEDHLQSGDVQAWIDKQPSVLQTSFNSILKEGTATDVIQMMDMYKADQDTQEEDPLPKPRGAGVPNSLSDISTAQGKGANVDIRDLLDNPEAMSRVMAGKTPDEIDTILQTLNVS